MAVLSPGGGLSSRVSLFYSPHDLFPSASTSAPSLLFPAPLFSDLNVNRCQVGNGPLICALPGDPYGKLSEGPPRPPASPPQGGRILPAPFLPRVALFPQKKGRAAVFSLFFCQNNPRRMGMNGRAPLSLNSTATPFWLAAFSLVSAALARLTCTTCQASPLNPTRKKIPFRRQRVLRI